MTERQTIEPLDWSDSLIEMLELQESLVGQLGDLSRRQAALVESARTDALLGLLTERQRVIERFAGVQDEVNRMTANLEERLQLVGESDRGRIRTLIGDIGDRLAEVMQRDRQDQEALEASRHRTRQEIASIDSGRSARQAYLAAGSGKNRFADQRG